MQRISFRPQQHIYMHIFFLFLYSIFQFDVILLFLRLPCISNRNAPLRTRLGHWFIFRAFFFVSFTLVQCIVEWCKWDCCLYIFDVNGLSSAHNVNYNVVYRIINVSTHHEYTWTVRGHHMRLSSCCTTPNTPDNWLNQQQQPKLFHFDIFLHLFARAINFQARIFYALTWGPLVFTNDFRTISVVIYRNADWLGSGFSARFCNDSRFSHRKVRWPGKI